MDDMTVEQMAIRANQVTDEVPGYTNGSLTHTHLSLSVFSLTQYETWLIQSPFKMFSIKFPNCEDCNRIHFVCFKHTVRQRNNVE